MNNAKPILELKDISIGFSGVQVLKKASFSLYDNEIHAIVGKNGAGKSSFMKVLTGVYRPDEGRVSILGGSKNKDSSSEASEKPEVPETPEASHKAVAMVYQDLSLVPSLSVLQNIFLVHHPYKKFGFLQDGKAKVRAQELLAQVGIPDLSCDQLVQNLSAGETQLVEIAKAISSKPRIIVFDEPTAALSDVETAVLFRTIKQLREQGMSIVYITHYLEDVMRICDRVTVLRNGEVVSTRNIAETNVKEIVSDMLGEEEQVMKVLHDKKKKQDKNKQKDALLQVTNASTARVGPITLYACAGEIIGIAGLLGSGRTEILRMLYGLDRLQTGSILIQGKTASIRSSGQATKLGIALVPEERRVQGLVLDFDIEENISLQNFPIIATHGVIQAQSRAKLADTTIQKLQIKTTGRSQVVRFLSGGNQQKVVIGKCLASNPKILLLDDPTFGVDVHAKTEIMGIIKEYAKEGNVVLFVSSEFSEIAAFCDRTYIVKKQKIASEIQNDSLQEEDLLVQVQ